MRGAVSVRLQIADCRLRLEARSHKQTCRFQNADWRPVSGLSQAEVTNFESRMQNADCRCLGGAAQQASLKNRLEI